MEPACQLQQERFKFEDLARRGRAPALLAG